MRRVTESIRPLESIPIWTLRNFSDLQALRMVVIGTWFTLLMCGLLVTYSLFCFAREGSWNFRSAAYLVFTWELEQRRTYRVLGFLLAGGICTMVLHSLMVKSFAKTSIYNVDAVKFLKMQFDLAVVIYSVKLILYPGTPVHRWEHSPIRHVLFKRHFVHLFSQSNDKLGAFLLDALWRANHGQMEALKHQMYHPQDAWLIVLLLSFVTFAHGPSQGKDSRVVRLRGVPWQASLQDVVNFLAEYQIPPQDVTMINRPDGKPTGETFILFPTPELAQRAIAEKANKEILGRYIETFRSCESELEDYKRVGNSSALPQYNQAPPPMEQAGFGSWGGPPSVFDQPWGDWGALPGQQAQATQYEWAQNGASTGLCLSCVEWSNQGAVEGVSDSTATSDAGNAFKDELVDRVKQIQRSHDDGKTKWEQYCLVQGTGNRDPARHTAYSKGEMPSKPAYSAVLRLRGVPFQSELSDVLAFLTLYGINESQIVIGRTPDGRKTGEAFVTFPSVEMAEAALQDRTKQLAGYAASPRFSLSCNRKERQKKEIHGRYIEVFRSSEEEREQARVHHDAFLRSHGGTGGINKEALVAEVKHIQRSSDDGRIRWDRFCDTLNTGNRDPTRHTCEALRAFSQAIRCGNDVELAAQQICVSSTVVRLRGVPFQGGTPDVLAFLAEYSVREPDITFIKKPDGRSTGEAFVMFQSPQLAEAAIEQKQRQEIQGRYIELFRSSQAELEEYKR
eukprot:g7103.t1